MLQAVLSNYFCNGDFCKTDILPLLTTEVP